MGDTYLEFEKPIEELSNKIKELKQIAAEKPELNMSKEIESLERKLEDVKKEIYSNLTAWEITQIARHPERPYFLDYVKLIFTDFIELHGDRAFRDDKAVVGGLAKIEDEPVVIIGQEKGRTIEEKVMRNFGMLHPEGYRKALRLMKLAEKFKRPVITFIDTPGAYPGIGAEERGQGEAIARNLKEMSILETPIIAIVIGEGGSGGALGIGVGDVVLMLENSIYSVISPEGCASILWRDSKKASEAAKALKLTANDLYQLGVIDEIIPEPLGGAHNDYKKTAANIKNVILKYLKKLIKIPIKTLLDNRYKKFRQIGEYLENKQLKTSRRRK